VTAVFVFRFLIWKFLPSQVKFINLCNTWVYIYLLFLLLLQLVLMFSYDFTLHLAVASRTIY